MNLGDLARRRFIKGARNVSGRRGNRPVEPDPADHYTSGEIVARAAKAGYSITRHTIKAYLDGVERYPTEEIVRGMAVGTGQEPALLGVGGLVQAGLAPGWLTELTEAALEAVAAGQAPQGLVAMVREQASAGAQFFAFPQSPDATDEDVAAMRAAADAQHRQRDQDGPATTAGATVQVPAARKPARGARRSG